jgi:hypothetical protein
MIQYQFRPLTINPRAFIDIKGYPQQRIFPLLEEFNQCLRKFRQVPLSFTIRAAAVGGTCDAPI